ncbi:MAG: sigma-70 family RNA polymerase sigma factor [Candidatus Zixiibacteriota bacterium]
MAIESELQVVIDSFLRGDHRQFEALRRQVAKYVARHFTGSDAERDDLTAEILQALLVGLRHERFRGESIRELAGYIYGIARLKIIRAVRNRARWPNGGPEDISLLHALGESDGQLADRDLANKILAAIDPKCRRLLEWKYVHGWSDQEIADHVRKSKNAVSTAICRCVKKAQELDVVREILYQMPQTRHSNRREGTS